MTEARYFHLDHIVPLALGGEHSYANTQVAHPPCNVGKGATPQFGAWPGEGCEAPW